MMLEERMRKACLTLQRLGITGNCVGFHYLMCAIRLVLAKPEILGQATKRLYPDVAVRCNSSPCAVEKGMRSAITAAWLQNPHKFNSILNVPFNKKPPTKRFIAVLVANLSTETQMIHIASNL